MQSELQIVEQEKVVTGKTVVSFNLPTPKWATWVFRVVFILTGVATFVMTADPAISPVMKVRIAIYLKALDMLVWGVTRAIGVDVSRDFNLPEKTV